MCLSDFLFSPNSEVQEQKESPPPPKTSAATQLDELMAHLCEMQAKVSTVPVVKPSGFISLEPSSTFLPLDDKDERGVALVGASPEGISSKAK